MRRRSLLYPVCCCFSVLLICIGLNACQDVSLEVSEKPDRPVDLSATPADKAVLLGWAEAARADSYTVYWNEDESVGLDTYKGRQNVEGTEWTATDLINGQLYSFLVVGLNLSGAGEPSSIVTCTPMCAPAAPLDVMASPGNALVVVTWSGSQGADGYLLYYDEGSTVAPGSGVQRKTGITSPYTVTPLLNGVQYAFAVAAYNMAGEGPASNPVTATPSNSNTPFSPTPVDGEENILPEGPVSLSWLTSNPNGDNLSFDVYIGVGIIPELPSATGLSVPAYQVVGPLSPHENYLWRVSVNNITKGYRTEGPEWSFITANNPPPAPTLVSPNNGAVDVALETTFDWSSVFDPDGDAVTYDLFMDTENPPSVIAASDVTDSQVLLSGLTPDTIYYWCVTAKDGYGGTAESSVRSFRTIDPPPAPSGLSATADSHYASVALSWNAPAGPVSEYRIYRTTSPGIYGSSPLATVTNRTYTDTNFYIGDCAGTYYYRISAVNAAGEGAPCTERSVTGSVPQKPSPVTYIKPHNAGYNFMDRYFFEIHPNSPGALSSRQYRLNRLSPDPALNWVSDNSGRIYISPIFAVKSGAVSYTYTLQSNNEWGASPWSDSFSINVPAALPIIYPSVTTPGSGLLRLTWTNPAGANKLRIFLVDENWVTGYTSSRELTTPTSTYDWTGLTSGSSRAFVIVPYDDTVSPSRVTERLFDADDHWSVNSCSLFRTVP